MAPCSKIPSSSPLPQTRRVVFVLSTTGDGEMPDPLKPLWRSLLRRELPPDTLSRLRFTLFGLGDSSYAKFNAAARKLHARLLQLGAVPFLERGLGDEQRELGIEGDLDAWAVRLWGTLEEACPLPPGCTRAAATASAG
jgi:sulfite reductase alpha subunit-like flavoprotein